ncbi:hypothetical protein TNCV_777831 [Trichonephila clavipes]|nr:hypothetical protein TNCV_777831 [Trichonephila clavipes]
MWVFSGARAKSGYTAPNIPVYSEAWTKRNAKVSPGYHFPPYRTPHTANMRVAKPTMGKEEKTKQNDKRKRVEIREGSLGYPVFVKPVFTKDSKPLEKRKRSLEHLGIVIPVLT